MHRQGEKGTVIGSRRRLGGAEVFFWGGGDVEWMGASIRVETGRFAW